MDNLKQKAVDVLKQNDRGSYTVPSPKLYPHQWLWDSCFVAIGLRHVDVQRAATELESLLRGQWANGMMPNIILSAEGHYWAGKDFWHSEVSDYAPKGVATSGLTQPPLLAIAVLAVARKMPTPEAHLFLKRLYPHLVSYHEWLYRERDPNNTGLVSLVNPWESGMDNSAPWMDTLKWMTALWISTLIRLRLDGVLQRRRQDTHDVPNSERMSATDALKVFHLAYLHRRNGYDSLKTLASSNYCLDDVGFNAILVRANEALRTIANEISEDLPYDLTYRIEKAPAALELLWSNEHKLYFSRHTKSQKLVTEASAASFLPLFSRGISPERAQALVQTLKSQSWWAKYPVPSAALDSKYFDPKRYWQGPTWINVNWMIISGLRHYGFKAEAETLKNICLELVEKSGFHEYFSPTYGSGHGIDNFSWTAALTIDLVS